MDLLTKNVPKFHRECSQARFCKGLGASRAPFGRQLGSLGRLLDALGRVLDASWASLGRSWGSLGRLLGTSWALLGASWVALGSFGTPWSSPTLPRRGFGSILASILYLLGVFFNSFFVPALAARCWSSRGTFFNTLFVCAVAFT